MKKFLLSALILAFFLFGSPVRAEQKSNKFGIHILEPTDLVKAQELVNSNGGDWGFVTIVIRDDDLDKGKWQNFFNQCREQHLVPLVRIATHTENNFWVKPRIEDVPKWADFLNNLNWPSKDQWLIVFNEPNQALEWGGDLNPEEYAQILDEFIKQLKAQNSNFNILNAGFDLAAANTSQTLDALLFWQRMEKAVPGIFQQLDGWASHSYPNHGYIGTPFQSGRTSIVGYQWELQVLENQFGLNKALPVFITETGWPYKINRGELFYTRPQVADYFKIAFEKVWLPDKRVLAVTPFVLSYPQPPFINFSWVTADNQEAESYLALKEIPKISWWPEQIFKLELVKVSIPPFLPTQAKYQGKMTVRNLGQSIWGEKEAFELKPLSDDPRLVVSSLTIPLGQKVKPEEKVELNFTLKSGTQSGEIVFSWEELPSFKLKIVPSSILTKAEYTLWQELRFFFEKIFLF